MADDAKGPFDFDFFLIGAGQTNVPLGPKLCQDGYKVGIAERSHMGGSCVNFGCMPSKAVHASARLAYLARRSSDWGIDIAGDIQPDLEAVLARARRWSDKSQTSIHDKFVDWDMHLHKAHARLAGREGDGFRIELDGEDGTTAVTARHVVLDPGSRTAVPPIDGLDLVQTAGRLITAETWLQQPTMFKRLLVLGGGYIGTEMAQFYARMGASVTLVETNDHILEKEDADVAGALHKCLVEEGLTIHTAVKAKSISAAGEAFTLSLESGETIDFDGMLLATGRKPETGNIGLDTVGLTTKDNGSIDTDEFGETSVAGLFVCGDARGGPAFTHTAHDDHHILLGRIRGERDPGGSKSREQRLVPWAVFTDPEIGRVGLSEKQCEEKGLKTRVICVSMKSNDRARVTGEPAGFVKLLVDAESDEGKLHGAAIVGHQAGELIHAFIMLMHLDRGLSAILDAVFIHPTLFEVIHQAVDQWHKSKSK